jgi:exodeoxyribonuclease V beta subunit
MKIVKFSKPPILESIFPNGEIGHVAIEASAGTGKTFTIQQIVIDLLLRGIPLEKIVLVTFTEKATLELKQRIRTIIRRFLLNDGDTHIESSTSYWSVGEKERILLKEALYNFDRAQIFTIHGFSSKILHEYNFITGELFTGSNKSAKELFKTVYNEFTVGDMLKDSFLTQLFNLWIEHYKENNLFELLEIALDEGIQYQNNLDLEILTSKIGVFIQTMGRKLPAKELLAYLKLHKNRDLNSPKPLVLRNFVKKLHEICLKYENDPVKLIWNLFDTRHPATKSDELTQKIKWFLDFRPHENSPAFDGLKEFIDFISIYEQKSIDTKMLTIQNLLPPLKELWNMAKEEAGILDFNDMIFKLYQILTSNNKWDHHLKNLLQNKYRYGIIDEFQDTDQFQWGIFKSLFLQNHIINSLCIVGDPKQAIYGFRGADLYTYRKAKDEINRITNRDSITLDKNYRSVFNMVKGVNLFFHTHKTTGSFFTGNNKYIKPVTCGIESHSSNLKPAITVYEIENHNYPASRITKLCAKEISSIIYSLIDSQKVKPENIFILTTTNKEGEIAASELRKLDITYTFYKKKGLFQSSEALHIKALLNSINSPEDSFMRLKALLTPFFTIKMGELDNYVDLPETHEISRKFKNWIFLSKTRNFSALFLSITDSTGIIRRIISNKKTELKRQNYSRIFEILLEEQEKNRLSITDMCKFLSNLIDNADLVEENSLNIEPFEGDKKGVQILTMHKSKGLQSDIVFILGGLSGKSRSVPIKSYFEQTNDGFKKQWFIKPKYKSQIKKVLEETIEEDERVYYVAFTRSKHQLFLPLIVDEKAPYGSTTSRYGAVNRRLYFLNSIKDENPIINELFSFQKSGSYHSKIKSPPLTKNTDYVDILSKIPPRLPERFSFSDRLGSKLFSYSSLKKENKPFVKPSKLEWVTSDKTASQGSEFGSYVHELMEHINLSTFQLAHSFESWLSMDIVDSITTKCFLKWNLNNEDKLLGSKMVYDGLTREFNHKYLDNLNGIYSASQCSREVEFFLPLNHKIKNFLQGDLTIDYKDSYIRGYIDSIIQHQDKIWIIDWKTDRLNSYDQHSLSHMVKERYQLQVKIYTAAVLAIFNITSLEDYKNRFGGVLYVFLRGIDKSDSGIYLSNPKIEDLSLLFNS